MRHLKPLRALPVSLFALLLPLLFVAASCQTLEPALQMGSAIGVQAGVINQTQANAIVRSASAVAKTFEDITPEQEYYIGRAVAATVLTRYLPYPEDDANRYVNLLGQTLAQASDRPETFGGYHFLVLETDEVNAFAAPGGLILVSRGMLRLCSTEDQLAAVLAHEIGHIQGRHGLRAIKTARLTTAFNVIAAEGAKAATGGQTAQLIEAFEGSITDVTSTLMNNGYSRDLEREADQTAVVILKRVGYDPKALVTMLSAMDKKMPRNGAGFAKTHPDPKERITDVRSKCEGPAASPALAERKTRFNHFMAGI